ncbi:MAG: glycosyltransferase [Desulfitobacterium sp.]|nr:glycosyltransferase [Desulfitobacterium sp.]
MGTTKVLQLIGGGEIGGAEKHLLALLEGLESDSFTLSNGCLIDGAFAKLTRERGIPTHLFPMKHPLDLTLIPKIMKIIKEEGYSLIHTHGSRANLLGRIAGYLSKIPVISTVHSSLEHDYLSRKAALLAIFLDGLTLPFTAGIITVSEALAEEVGKRGGKNIRTIYNGIPSLPSLQSPLERQKLRTKFRHTWGIPENAFVIGTIARLHPTKGLEYLIEGVKLLHKDYPHLHLLIIGEGPLHSELEEQLNKGDLNYTLTGYLPKAYEGLPAMDLFTLPSLSEGMGLVLLEAMQASLPIVATKVGGIPEIINHRDNGLLVPPQDPRALAQAYEELLKNTQLAQKISKKGHDCWTQFGLTQMLVQTRKFYEEILYSRVK